jgi:hypothetical protein
MMALMIAVMRLAIPASTVVLNTLARHIWFPGGFSFEIAFWDWPLAEDWCWDCGGDNFVFYDDPDHPGWYRIYNPQTGAYIHAQYMGS